MISWDAIDPLIVVHGVPRCELHNDPELWLRIHLPNRFTEAENVFLICEELESRWISTIILHMKNSLLRIPNFDCSKVKCCCGKINWISLCYPLALKLNRITTNTINLVMAAWEQLGNCWFVLNFDKVRGFSRNISRHLI